MRIEQCNNNNNKILRGWGETKCSRTEVPRSKMHVRTCAIVRTTIRCIVSDKHTRDSTCPIAASLYITMTRVMVFGYRTPRGRLTGSAYYTSREAYSRGSCKWEGGGGNDIRPRRSEAENHLK